ncbi:MAG: RecX family transcriptional regulator, partial [Thermomicrobiaceae bacterium]|nr:RecX family transcriptional regulator [Thermomicrobiaceae bacterium]
MQTPNIRSGRITAIEDQVRDPERVSVFIEGAFAFGIDRVVAAQQGLHVDRVLSEAEVATLLAADEVARATNAALQFLAYRPRSTREVRDRLTRRGFSPEAVEATIAKLQGWRYLDDAEFARFWVENRAEHQPRGRRLLVQELRQKGVDVETARQAVDETELDELPAAVELARKRLPSLRGLDEPTRRRRLAAYLQRRGYDPGVVRPARPPDRA